MSEREDAVEALARAHYCRGVSSMTVSQVSRDTGHSSAEVTHSLKRLRDEGAVEALGDETRGPNRYRLTGADEFAPHRDPTASAGEERPYWVPMRDPASCVQWRYLGRGCCPEEAADDALDKYEERYGFRPEQNGEPAVADEVEQ